ncbi:MAG TPA: hypothetical protein VFF13_06210 [archaeon]|nr:hypothetical protein [archaeon]
MGLVFKTVVDSLYWGLALIFFFWILSIFSVFEFGKIIFTIPGFFIALLYMFLVVYVLRLPQKWKNGPYKETKN